MRTELTSPVPDVATQTLKTSQVSKPQTPKAQATLVQTRTKPEQATPRQAAPASIAVAISMDENRNTIYRFLDQATGVLIRQVPPEEVLRVMRNIDEMLQASQQRIKVDA